MSSAPTISTTTASGGSYTLTGVPSGTQTINASLTNYVSATSGNITVPVGGNANAGALALNRTTVTLSGWVKDSVSNAALSGANVSVQEQPGASSGTDGGGNYSISGVYWGSVHLVVSLDGYTTKTVPVTLAANTTPTQDILLDSAFGAITGQVEDAVTSLGLPDANVSLTDNPSLGSGVDAYGNFTLSNVPVGTHTITATRDSYATAITNPIAVTPGTTTTAPVISMTPDACSISGVVQDANTGNPIPGATVTAARTGQTATTDGTGTYTLTGLASGIEYLAASISGYAVNATNEIFLHPGDTPTGINIGIAQSSNGSVGVIHGTVRNPSGTPIAGITVAALGVASTTTAADGTYAITVPGGGYVLVASGTGYRTIVTKNQGNWSQGEGQSWQIQHDFVLPGATDTGTLAMTAHDPVLLTPAYADVWLYTLTSAYRVIVPATGQRTITGVPPGPVFGGPFPETLTSGATLPIDVDAPMTLPGTSPNWVVAGIVVQETTMAPVAGATVTLTNTDTSFVTTATTNANGRWSFANGPEGDYSVTYAGPGGLTLSNPWTFTANDNNWYNDYAALTAPSDAGSITCSTPASGATLTADLTHLDCVATLTLPSDYVTTATVSLSSGQVQTQNPTFDLDGKTFHIDLTSTSQDGPQNVYVSALSWWGTWFWGSWMDLTIPVVIQKPVVPAQVVLDPATTTGGTQVNGTVFLNVNAPAGDQIVSLSSSDATVATVPATVTIGEGSNQTGFTVNTLPQATATSATISASANGGTSSATLMVTPSTFGSISGQVVDAVTGEGLSEVTLVLSSDTSIGVQTNWDGQFVLANVPVGSQSVLASHDGYADTLSANVVVIPATAAPVPTINLPPNPATIQGTIFVAGTNTPAGWTTITAARSGQTTMADGGGNFTLTGLAEGYEILVATAGGYAPSASSEIPLNPGQTVTMSFDIFQGGNRPSGIVHGTVRDSTGAALSGVTVTIVGGPTIVTGEDGTYSTTLPGGRYVITAQKAGYQMAICPNQEDAPLWYSNWQIQHDFVLYTPNETAIVNIQQIDPVLLTPVAGRASMQTLFAAYAADTPPSGQRTLSAVPAGLLLGWDTPLNLLAGGLVSLTFTNGAGAIQTSPHWVTGGLVYRATTSEPVAGAVVTITNSGAGFTTTATTDANGRWSYQSGPIGAYAVTASADGGLASLSASTFTAQDDGGVFFSDLPLFAPADPGTLAINSPAPGSVLPAGLTAISCTATLPRPGDYITSASVSVSQGQAQIQNIAYNIDGVDFTINVTATIATGPLTVTVGAQTWYGVALTASTTVTVQPAPVPAALSLAPAVVSGGYPSTGTVTLGAAAGSGGVTVNLTSSDPGVAATPATVVVPQGSSSAPFTVTTAVVASSTPVTISASAGGVTQTAILTVGPLSVTSVFLSPANVLGGASTTGTVTINTAALSGGFTVALASSNPAVAPVPAAVTVPQGATSAQFTVTTTTTDSPTSITIAASGGGATQTASLVVGPLAVASVSLNPTAVIGGASSTAVVTLNGAAPAGGFAVTLASSNPAVAEVPATVTVLQGATTAQFTVTTLTVTASASATITASEGGVSQTAALQVNPLAIAGFSESPSPIVGGNICYFGIALTGPAPAGGVIVTLTSSNPAVVPLPETITVSEGAIYANGAVATALVAAQTTVVLSASLGNQSVTVTLQVNPIVLDYVQVSDIEVLGGLPEGGYVVINVPAPPDGVTVALFSSTPAVAAVPNTVTVPAGQTSGWFAITTVAVTTRTTVQIQASLLGQSVSKTFMVDPVGPISIECTTTTFGFVGGYPASCTVLLNSVAPSGGLVVNLSSDNGAFPVPAAVQVPAGAQKASFTTTLEPLTGSVLVTITAATASGVSAQETILVSQFGLSGVSVTPSTVAPNTSSTGTVSLNAPAPTGGVVVTLSSGNPVATVPPSVTVEAGSRSADFTIAVGASGAATVTITATALGGSLSGTLTISGQPTLDRVSLPSTSGSGGAVTGTVFIDGVAPVGGLVINLTSNTPAVASVPATVTIPVNASSTTFQIATTAVTTPTPVTISASLQGVAKSATVNLVQLELAGTLAPPDTTCNGGLVYYGTVLLNAPAADPGPTIALASSDPTVVVYASVTVNPGQTSASFEIDVYPVAAPKTVTISASFNGVTQTFQITAVPAPIDSITLSPSSVARGGTSTVTVYLNGEPLDPSVTVALSSSDPTIATVPATSTSTTYVLQPGPFGAGTYWSFPVITTSPTSAGGTVTISATYLGVTKTAPLTVTVPDEAVIVGQVQAVSDPSSPSGEPLAGATVTVTGTANWTTTDDAGRFTLVQPAGTYTLTVSQARCATATTASFTATNGTTVDLGTITLFYATSVIGTVVNAVDLTPLAGVTVATNGLSTVTDPSGNFLLVVPAGFYIFTFSLPGFMTVASDVTPISLGQVTDFFQVLLPPLTVASVSVSPQSVDGGQASTGQVSLSGPASPGGVAVSLTSSNPVVAPVPATVTVPGGATSASFAITAGHVASATPVTITASLAASSTKAALTVMPWIASLSLTPASVTGGGSATGAVTLSLAAPTGGVTVGLTSSDPSSATVPTSVTIPAGGTSASFQVTTQPVSSPDSVTISVAAGGETAVAALQVVPAALASLVLNPTSVSAGGSSVGTVTLSAAAPTGGAAVGLTSSNTQSATVPVTVTVAAGATSATFTVTTLASAPSSSVTISATYGTVTQTATLTFVPAALTSLVLNPTSVSAGGSSVGTVTLNGPAPAGGAAIGLTSSNTQSATVPASVTVPAGSTSATFTVTTLATAPSSSVTISATYGTVTQTATLSFVPVALTSLVLNPTSVSAGGLSVGTVTLNGLALAGGAAIGLTSSDTQSATVPASVTVPAGSTSATFTVTTLTSAPSSSVTISATYGGVTQTAALTLGASLLTGVAPGWVLPGDANLVVYGSNLTQGTSILIEGPVYALTDVNQQNPLCELSPAQCPTTTVPATANSDGTALSFSAPAGSAPGMYYLQTQSGSGAPSPNGVWLVIDQAQKAYPPLAPGHGSSGIPIWSGQTITGTFVAGGDPSGQTADFNMYYFVATAGSTIDVALNRVDTSLSWEDPNSLDPAIVIGAPDGLIYQNLVALDNQPGVDLNASLHGAVLPLSGMYYVLVETSKGFGDYQLQFTITSMAPATTQVFPFADNLVTVPVGQTTYPTAFMLDPRGYRLSSANVTFALTPAPDDTGTVAFSGGATVQTAPDGSAQATVTATGVGKISYTPSFVDRFATSLAAAGDLAASADAGSTQRSQRIPRYQAVARQPYAVAGLDADGTVRFTREKYQRLPIEKTHTRHQGTSAATKTPAAGAAVKSKSGPTKPPSSANPTGRGAPPSSQGSEPLDASTAVPLPEPKARLIASAQSLTSCGGATVVQENVPAGTVLQPPYTVTLTDLTPSTGQTTQNGVVGVDGIHGHRITKTARLQFEILDATGSTPNYPVLVQLSSVGPYHGFVILDPAGAAIPCSSATFVWHQQDAQGNLIAANDIVGYQLGSLSLYVGVQPDPNNPSQLDPVWGSAESLEVCTEASATGQPTAASTVEFDVHPEPWAPDHFECFDNGVQCPDVWEYWSGYQLNVLSQPPSSVPWVFWNAYFLCDEYGNIVYGQTDTSATQPGQGVTVEFTDQTSGTTGGDPAGYTLTTTWPMNPGPTGKPESTLSLTYPDDPAGDWGGGTVTKDITYQFDSGPTLFLLQAQSYEKRLADEGKTVVDGPMPMVVAPGATQGLATLTNGTQLTTPRLVLLALSGSYVTTNVTGGSGKPLVEPSPVSGWGWQVNGTLNRDQDTWSWVQWNPAWDLILSTQQTESFRLTLFGPTGCIAPDGSFVVHTCPRVEHETDGAATTQGCQDLATPSASGTVAVTLNQAGSARGYMGIELTQAPIAPGTYYVWVESLNHVYRTRESAQDAGRTSDEEYSGGFEICTVRLGSSLIRTLPASQMTPLP